MQPGGVLSVSDTGKNTRNLLGTLPVSVGKILSYSSMDVDVTKLPWHQRKHVHITIIYSPIIISWLSSFMLYYISMLWPPPSLP